MKSRRWRVLATFPLVCLAGGLATGLVLGLKTAAPSLAVATLPMQVVRPLHTLSSIGLAISGIAALLVGFGEELGARRVVALRGFLCAAVPTFLVGGALSIVLSHGSGREYLGWSASWTLVLAAICLVLVIGFFADLRAFAARSAEAAWLIGLGLCCMPLGMIEEAFNGAAGSSYARELTYQWHALDIVFAGWTACLYGFGVLAAGGPARPLRPRWLFLLAAFTFVSTFGHHAYASPQADVLKTIALTASLVAGVSFLRHLRTVLRRRSRPYGDPVAPLLRTVELWTLVAIGSGILLAIPRVNHVLHGTHAVVAHAMGSTIGVDVMLVLAGVVALSRGADASSASRIARRARWVGIVLALVWIDLLAAGATKGLLRLDHEYSVYQPVVKAVLAPLPVLGAALAVALGLVGLEVARLVSAGPRAAKRDDRCSAGSARGSSTAPAARPRPPRAPQPVAPGPRPTPG